MTRSRKRPITGITCAESEKSWKSAAHRAERRMCRQRLQATADDTDRRMHRRLYGDPWCGPKDGKHDWTGTSFAVKAARK